MSEYLDLTARLRRDAHDLDAAYRTPEDGPSITSALLLEAADALAALAQRSVGQGWQPIETAPSGPVLVAWSHQPTWVPQSAYRRADGEWTEADGDGRAMYSTPTHWMPLPSPPEAD